MAKPISILFAPRTFCLFLICFFINVVTLEVASAEPEWKSRENITKTVTRFYYEYITKAKRPKDQRSVLKAHLTPDFFNQFQELVEGMDADPIVRAEHWGKDYRHKIRVYNVSLEGVDTARADVRLGEIPQGVKSPSGPVTLRVSLKKVGNQWRIASVERGFDNP